MTTTTHPVIDMTVIRVPEHLSPVVDGALVATRLSRLHTLLDERAQLMLTAQNPGAVLTGTEWTIATTPEQAADWSLPHNCEQCRDGRARAVQSLTVEPGRPVALGVLYYDEPT